MAGAEERPPALPQPTPEQVLVEAALYGWLSGQGERWFKPVVPA